MNVESLTRVCSQCKVDKSLTNFGNRKDNKLGKTTECKECLRSRNAKHYLSIKEEHNARSKRYNDDHKDEIRAWHRAYYLENRDHRIAKAKEWAKSNPGKRAEICKRYETKHPEKERCRVIFQGAVQRGKIEKPDRCERCNEVKARAQIQGHHHDYKQPFVVKWLCAACHALAHREEREATRRSGA